MNALAIWLQVGQAILTLIIAAAVGLVAFLQWRTAHGRLVLDLFEKRFAVYELVRKAVSVVNTTGKTSPEAEIDLLKAMKQARFLFGEDVCDYLDKMWENFCRNNAAASMVENGPNESRKENIEARTKSFREIIQFYYEGSDIFAPYMRMDHRLDQPFGKPRERRATGRD